MDREAVRHILHGQHGNVRLLGVRGVLTLAETSHKVMGLPRLNNFAQRLNERPLGLTRCLPTQFGALSEEFSRAEITKAKGDRGVFTSALILDPVAAKEQRRTRAINDAFVDFLVISSKDHGSAYRLPQSQEPR